MRTFHYICKALPYESPFSQKTNDRRLRKGQCQEQGIIHTVAISIY
jgi:hypothetical protein